MRVRCSVPSSEVASLFSTRSSARSLPTAASILLKRANDPFRSESASVAVLVSSSIMLWALRSRSCWNWACNCVADRAVQGDGPRAVVVADVEIEDFGGAELGPLGRHERDHVAELLDIGGGGGRTDFHQRGTQDGAALDQLEDGFLDGLHFVGTVELAQAALAGGRFVAEDEGLRGLPGGLAGQGVHGRDDRHQRRRRQPARAMDCQETDDFLRTGERGLVGVHEGGLRRGFAGGEI